MTLLDMLYSQREVVSNMVGEVLRQEDLSHARQAQAMMILHRDRDAIDRLIESLECDLAERLSRLDS